MQPPSASPGKRSNNASPDLGTAQSSKALHRCICCSNRAEIKALIKLTRPGVWFLGVVHWPRSLHSHILRLSASPSKPDVTNASGQVCYGPTADIGANRF